MWVHDDWRGAGLGSRLLRHLEDQARALGHDVQVAYDGAQALDIAVRSVADVALLDLGLPVIDGYELAERLRVLPGWARTGIVALTGYGLAADRERTRREGFDAHFVKPIDLDELMALLGQLSPNNRG